MNLENFTRLFAKAPDKFPSGLASRYPRLLTQILTLWDTPKELEGYLNGLVVDQRGSRQGFPTEILQEILFISALFEKWRAERQRRADMATLTKLSPKLVEDLERAQQKLTPELNRQLSALQMAVHKENIELLEINAALFNQHDRDGMTLLMHAACSGSEKSLIHLLKSGANPHLSDTVGNRALHWAVTMNRLRSSEILLYFGADTMMRNAAGASALTLASIKPDPGIAARLLDYGGDPNSPDGKGDFPLHKAVVAGAHATVKLLLQSGASKDLKNRDGKSPFDLAAKPDIIAVFQEHHATLMRNAMSK